MAAVTPRSPGSGARSWLGHGSRPATVGQARFDDRRPVDNPGTSRGLPRTHVRTLAYPGAGGPIMSYRPQPLMVGLGITWIYDAEPPTTRPIAAMATKLATKA